MAVLSGIIAAAGALGGAAIASGGAKSAAKTSAAAADRASEVQQQIYNQNAQILNPYVQAGLPATAQINALLGLTPSMPAQGYQTQGYQGQPTPQANALMPANDTGYQPYPGYQYGGRGGMVEDWSFLAPNAMGDMSSNGGGWGIAGGQFIPQVMQGQTVNTMPTQQSAESAFDKFRNYTGYDFRLKQGFNALNSGWAGNGMLKSGAAGKAAINYGQGMASQEFGNYMNMLGNQQALGLSAASATAGVGQGFANSMGNIAMQNGANQANAALSSANAMGGAVNSLGMIGSNLLGRSSFGGGGTGITAPAIVGGSGQLAPMSGGWRDW